MQQVELDILNKKNILRLEKELPVAIDFLCRSLDAGHSIQTCISILAKQDYVVSPVFQEIERCLTVGYSLEKSLSKSLEHFTSKDFCFFITILIVQNKTGQYSTKVLSRVAKNIRRKIVIQSSIKAKTAENKMTGYVLGLAPLLLAVFLYNVVDGWLTPLFDYAYGKYIIAYFFISIVVGLFIINKITDVEL